MHKVTSFGATETNEFTDGNAFLGIPRTRLEAAFMNTLQRELAGLVEQAGRTLAADNDTQVRASVMLHVLNMGALRLLPVPSVPNANPVMVYVEGTSSSDDGGDGIFRWQYDSNKVDDNDLVIRPTTAPATGRWLRVKTRGRYGITSAENAAEAIVLDTRRPVGNLLRYCKADGTDETNAIRAALRMMSMQTGYESVTAGPGHMFAPGGRYGVTGTLLWEYLTAFFAQDAIVVALSGSFNVMEYGREAIITNPYVRVASTTFGAVTSAAAHYVSSEHRLQSVHNSPRIIAPRVIGNTTVLGNLKAKGMHFHAYVPNDEFEDASLSFVRSTEPYIRLMGTALHMEADGSHPDLGVSDAAYVTSCRVTDLSYTQCRRGVELDSHDGASGVVLNFVSGHMNAHDNIPDKNSERVFFCNSSGNIAQLGIWDWSLALPHDFAILTETSERNDVVIYNQGIHRVDDQGENNRVRCMGTVDGNIGERYWGSFKVNDVELGLQEGTFEAELDGMAAPVTEEFTYALQGNTASLRAPALSVTGTSNATTMKLLNLPEIVRPNVTKIVSTHVVDNNVVKPACIEINADGTVFFGIGAVHGGFTASGTKGLFDSWAVQWPMNG